ncbi:MAG: hypothetical protein L0Y80_08915 [Ignavibacteriae bacterium]|nr:hypothetical protein [Ignavibacteriota bacterium]
MLQMSLVFLTLFFAGHLQTPPTMSKQNRLKPVAFMVGGTWTAKGSIEGFGEYVAERTYWWSLDSNFIEQRHRMSIAGSQIEAHGVIGWDAVSKKIVGYGFGNDGGIATTTATVTAGTIVFEGSRMGGYNPGALRGTFTIKNENEYTESVETQKDGKWIPSFSLQWVRNKN